MQRTELDEARREIAATLAKRYSEIASIVPDDGPPFNLSRLVLGMAGELDLQGTREDEVTSLAGTLSGAFSNPYRRLIPWSVFTGKRAMATTPGASGGYLVGGVLSARPRRRCDRGPWPRVPASHAGEPHRQHRVVAHRHRRDRRMGRRKRRLVRGRSGRR